jgi:hypothetical protein
LPPKPPAELVSTERLPQHPLSLGRIAAQSSGSGSHCPSATHIASAGQR